MPGYRVEVIVLGEESDGWVGNGLVFPTAEQADGWGKALDHAWILVKEYRVVETQEKPNYRFVGPTNHDIVEIK